VIPSSCKKRECQVVGPSLPFDRPGELITRQDVESCLGRLVPTLQFLFRSTSKKRPRQIGMSGHDRPDYAVACR
jgi:hypothetical protein